MSGFLSKGLRLSKKFVFHNTPPAKHSRLGAKGPPLVGEEVRKRVGT
jgi:hypothetical protein